MQLNRATLITPVLLVAMLAMGSACSQPPGEAGDTAPGIDPGRRLLGDRDCLSCHALQGQGGNLAPEFGAELSAKGEAWISDYLTGGRHIDVYPGNGHANFVGISEVEAGQLARYLAGLTVSASYQGPAGSP
ncbi:MAG: c-type cytochrome [Leptospirillia bacterium]